MNEKLIKIVEKYKDNIKTSFPCIHGSDISEDKLKEAMKTYAKSASVSEVICYFPTIFGGKCGYVLTDRKFFYQEFAEKGGHFYFDEVKRMKVIGNSADKKKHLVIEMDDGRRIVLTASAINKTPLMSFIEELVAYNKDSSNFELSDGSLQNINIHEKDLFSTAAVNIANKSEINTIFDEEKFHASQGHGFAAERANNLLDALQGKNARILGDDNAKNGADRWIFENGEAIYIQSKYCQTGRDCVAACFDDNGQFRYWDPNHNPMQIEVPADKFDAAIEAMQERIKEGKVDGINDPEDAKHIIRKGHFTYAQAKNIAKAGTIESITYDAVNGIIISGPAVCMSVVITFASSLWKGEDLENALKIASLSGLKVCGTVMVTTLLAGQLSKAGLNSAMVKGTETIVKIMGPKASAVLVNAYRDGSNIYGAAAMKSAAKLLRGNIITGVVTVAVLSSADLIGIFRGRISGKQFFKNLMETSLSIAAGTIGGMGLGAACGSTGAGVGAIVGAVGGMATGFGVSIATRKILDQFIENDGDEMVGIIQNEFVKLSEDYLLSKNEAEKTVDVLSDTLASAKILKDMFESKNRKSFARHLLVPIIETIVARRTKIIMPDQNKLFDGMKALLEDISDEANLIKSEMAQ